MHYYKQKLTSFLITTTIAFTLGLTAAKAQIGTGWIEQAPTRGIQLNKETGTASFPWATTTNATVDSPPSAQYTRINGVETFYIYDKRSNRAEIRTYDDYSVARQWQGEVRVSAPSENECIHQIFQENSGPILMIKEYQASGGTLKRYGGGQTLVTGIGTAWTRINTAHVVGSSLDIYVNGSLKWHGGGAGVGNQYYTKYGCYGTLGAATAKIEYRNIHYWKR